jgi:hypothetical protein
MNKKNLARFISFVFGPIFLWPLGLLLIIFNSQLSFWSRNQILTWTFIFLIFLPLILFIVALKTKIISDFDITKKKERRVPMLIFVFLLIINLMFVRFFGIQIVFFFFLILFFLIIVNSLITVFWKISSHMAINTITIVLINHFFGGHFVYLFLILPIIFWARFFLKRHTTAQLLGGFLVNFVLLTFFLRFFS